MNDLKRTTTVIASEAKQSRGDATPIWSGEPGTAETAGRKFHRLEVAEGLDCFASLAMTAESCGTILHPIALLDDLIPGFGLAEKNGVVRLSE